MTLHDFRKQHPQTEILPEDLAMDWYIFENRIRQFNYEMFRPILAQQKKLRTKIGGLMAKVDS